jgi:hypothetical protein
MENLDSVTSAEQVNETYQKYENVQKSVVFVPPEQRSKK